MKKNDIAKAGTRLWTRLIADGVQKRIARGSAGQRKTEKQRIFRFQDGTETPIPMGSGKTNNLQAEQVASNSPETGLAGFLYIQMMFAKLRGLRQIIQRLAGMIRCK